MILTWLSPGYGPDPSILTFRNEPLTLSQRWIWYVDPIDSQKSYLTAMTKRRVKKFHHFHVEYPSPDTRGTNFSDD